MPSHRVLSFLGFENLFAEFAFLGLYSHISYMAIEPRVQFLSSGLHKSAYVVCTLLHKWCPWWNIYPQMYDLCESLFVKSVQKLRALNFKIVAVSRASNRFVSIKYRWKAFKM